MVRLVWLVTSSFSDKKVACQQHQPDRDRQHGGAGHGKQSADEVPAGQHVAGVIPAGGNSVGILSCPYCLGHAGWPGVVGGHRLVEVPAETANQLPQVLGPVVDVGGVVQPRVGAGKPGMMPPVDLHDADPITVVPSTLGIQGKPHPALAGGDRQQQGQWQAIPPGCLGKIPHHPTQADVCKFGRYRPGGCHQTTALIVNVT
ncbi:hypothetical protein NC796_01850 [Aliifodinibius sp. S!AR15-10]|nr:hypothetical protein [Aliifodinibius sp. S!AR15-10]MDR8389862.1 hypothetical protein [Aliifodinibius sp. S!AR15-10]